MFNTNQQMVICAVRYCIGRMTYVVSDCADWLIKIWPDLDNNVKNTIINDIESAFVSDNFDRANGKKYKELGHDCDRAQWERVRRLWSGK